MRARLRMISGVTDVPVWALITSVGLVCTFYSSIGGLKAVVCTVKKVSRQGSLSIAAYKSTRYVLSCAGSLSPSLSPSLSIAAFKSILCALSYLIRPTPIFCARYRSFYSVGTPSSLSYEEPPDSPRHSLHDAAPLLSPAQFTN